jgi:hypothetical protein
MLIIPVPFFSQALKNNLQLAQNKTVYFIKSMDPRTSIKQTALVLIKLTRFSVIHVPLI